MMEFKDSMELEIAIAREINQTREYKDCMPFYRWNLDLNTHLEIKIGVT